MRRNIFKKIIGGTLLISLLFMNLTNVFAVMYVRPSNYMENKLSLHEYGALGSKNFDKGYAGLEAKVSNSGSTIEVTATISTVGTEPTAITNVQAKIDLGPDITNNFNVNVPEQTGVAYTSGSQTINWMIGDMAASETEKLNYTLTLKDSYNFETFDNTEYFSKDRFYTMSLFHIWHSLEGNNQPEESGTKFELFNDRDCIPFVIIDSEIPPTGIFTDVIILSAIIVGAVGILVVTLKSNRFANI